MDRHKTREGEVIGIPEMEDEHLVNTIKLFTRKMTEVTEAMNQENLRKYVVTEGVEFDIEDAKRAFQSLKDKLKRYVYEAAMRGLIDSDIVDALQKAHGRTGRIIDFPRPVVNSNNVEIRCISFDDEYEPSPF